MRRKEIEQVIERGRQMGWTVKLSNGGHWKWTHPDGGIFYSSQTPSCPRAVQRIEQDMKKTCRRR